MPKYLIQDIVPPHKKRASGHGGEGHGDTETHHSKGGTHHKEKDVHADEHGRVHIKKRPKPAATELSAPVSIKQPQSSTEAAQEEHEYLPTEDEPVSTDNVVMHFPPSEEASQHANEEARELLRDALRPAASSLGGGATVTNPYNKSSYSGEYSDDGGSDGSIFSPARWLFWGSAGLVVIGLLLFGMSMFGGATVTVLPKQDSIPMDQMLSATKDAQNGELPYAVMRVTISDTREVPATGEKTVTSKASGKIVVYNKQTVSQRLIKNTRFQGPSGKIYRINESITVPKASGSTPGSIETIVYADEAGSDYNTEPVDFTVPGLKGGPIYDKVYARSKGSITGGASGTTKIVSDADLKQASDELRLSLETKLRTKARGDINPSQLSYDSGVFIDTKEPTLVPQQASDKDKAVVSAEGTLYAVVFDRDMLTRGIARALIPTWSGEQITVKNLDTFEFTMNAKSGAQLWSENKLNFSIKGTAELEWVVNVEEFSKLLIDLPRSDFNSTMTKYPMIARAKASVNPFWKRSFPSEASNITIKLVDSMPE
jgi:hypothetical protein